MNYREYVIGAYAVFALFLAWDFLAPRIRLARTRRAILLRERRQSTRKPGTPA